MRNSRLAIIACVLGLTAALQAQGSTRLQGFSVVLLLGETQGAVPTQGLSSSAQRALADIREFLPYKGYRVIDTQWVAGSDFGTSRGRIRGLEDKDYEFVLETFPSAPAIKPGEPNGPLSRARFLLTTAPIGFNSATGSHFGAKTMLDNSFAIKTGETVVVGTSRVEGDSALVVLLTAVGSK